MEVKMPINPRSAPGNHEALLLDQALDAVNQHLSGTQVVPARALETRALENRSAETRSGLACLSSRKRESGTDFETEDQRLQSETPLALPGTPGIPTAPAPLPAAPSAEAPQPAKPAPPPAPTPAPDAGLETTRLFLQFVEKREKQLFDLMRTVVAKDQPALAETRTPRIEDQIERLGKIVADLNTTIDAQQPRYPRSVS
jgi:hypothetical protein